MTMNIRKLGWLVGGGMALVLTACGSASPGTPDPISTPLPTLVFPPTIGNSPTQDGQAATTEGTPVPPGELTTLRYEIEGVF